MKSPFTGGEVQLMREAREMVFRKERFSYTAHFYVCTDTQEQFTTTAIDTLNINQVYNQYRVKYGIPFPDEINKIRTTYGLSASKMSEILGFGANQYRLYENGEIPSESNGKIIKSIMTPDIFSVFVQNAENQFNAKDYSKIIEKIERVIQRIDRGHYCEKTFPNYHRSAINGYAPQSHSRLKNIILYFVEKYNGVFNTKMNKLLFYTDFLSYKSRGFAMSGLAYKAITYGPVPFRWNTVYDSIEDIYPEIVEFSSGNSGVKLCSFIQPDLSEFSQEDMAILEIIAATFARDTANDISNKSHEEDAWIKYNGTKDFINFNEAFTTKAV